MREFIILLGIVSMQSLGAQNTLSIDGQLSTILNFSLENELPVLGAIRYLPKLDYETKIDSFKALDFEFSTNLNATISTNFKQETSQFDLSPYRLWMRYSSKRFELRAGLQKIEFGSASLLRPLQWFNQIDPRDPLQLTNGVWGVLGRYYFLNNANIWLWALYGNSDPKGFEFLSTYDKSIEYGTRIQYPVTKGELAISYHNREVDLSGLGLIMPERSYENRVGLDGKWDLGIGLWFELTHTWIHEDVGAFRYTDLASIGLDYTFGLGNGLNVSSEFMVFRNSNRPFDSVKTSKIAALVATYPFGLFDRLSLYSYFNIEANDFSVFLNYEHQFSVINGYVMLYYNSGTNSGLSRNELVYNFNGPGIRFLAVYNH